MGARKYTDGDIAAALNGSTSLFQASRISGISRWAMRKRCTKGELLKAYERCRARGLARVGKRRWATTQRGEG